MDQAKIEPFNYQKATNISEHNQIVDKVNELIDGTNELDNKRVNAVNQSFDDENRILATTLKTVDGTEIKGTVYVPGGGDGGDIVVDKIDYYDTLDNIEKTILKTYADGTYECSLRFQCETADDNDPATFIATTMKVTTESETIRSIWFRGTGGFGGYNNSTAIYIGDGSYNINWRLKVGEQWKDLQKGLDITYKSQISGFIIKGIKGAAITPYTASTGIKIDDENSTIAVDETVIATKEDIATVNANVANVDTKADTANTNALKAYKSAYVKDNTMTFEKGNGDTDTIALPTGTSYVAGNGITISDNEIAVDTSKIATTAVTTEIASGVATNRNLINGTFDDVNISGTHLVFDKVNGEQKEIEISVGSEWVKIDALPAISDFNVGTEIKFRTYRNSSVILSTAHAIVIQKDSNMVIFSGSGTANDIANNKSYNFTEMIFTSEGLMAFVHTTYGDYNLTGLLADIPTTIENLYIKY